MEDYDQNLYDREARFFSFNPVLFSDDIYNLVDDYLADGTDALENALKKDAALDDSQDTTVLLNEGTDGVLGKLRDIFDRNFDKFEMYVLRNIFAVPEDLETHTGEMEPEHDELAAKEDKLTAELQALHEKLSKARESRRSLLSQRATLARDLGIVEEGANAIADATAPFRQKELPKTVDKLAGQAQELKAVQDRMTAVSDSMMKDLSVGDAGSTGNASLRNRGVNDLARSFKRHKENIGGPSTENLSVLNARLRSS